LKCTFAVFNSHLVHFGRNNTLLSRSRFLRPHYFQSL